MAKKMTKPKEKFKKVLKEFKEGKLHSGSKKGPKVSNPKQAVAIAYSEERHKASHDEKHPKSHSKMHKSSKKHDPKHHSLLNEVMHDYMQGAKKLHAYMAEHAEHEEMRDDHMMERGSKHKSMKHAGKKKPVSDEKDGSSTTNIKPKRPAESDLNNLIDKPKDEPFYDYAKGDAVRAYFEDGLTAKTGKDNDVESLKFSRRSGVKARK